METTVLLPEAADYLSKANERLRAARLLLQENLWDDSASRAYYAALFACKAALLQQGLTAKSHDGAIKLFGVHFIKTNILPKDLGIVLSRLRTMREKAEYSPANKTKKEEADWAISAAGRFVVEIEKLLAK